MAYYWVQWVELVFSKFPCEWCQNYSFFIRVSVNVTVSSRAHELCPCEFLGNSELFVSGSGLITFGTLVFGRWTDYTGIQAKFHFKVMSRCPLWGDRHQKLIRFASADE
jgi:hypothetical protein